jgi:hypothetical protein
MDKNYQLKVLATNWGFPGILDEYCSLVRKRVMMEASRGVLTFLTEFGPMDYMPALPYTRQPLANQ